MEADNVPSLLTLCLDALTRRQVAEHQPKRSTGSPGSFWESNEECAATPAAILLSQLPLPAESKLMTLRTLRHAGLLSDEALLRLTDESFECLNLASCRSVSAALTMLPALCPLLTALDLSWQCQLRDETLLEMTVGSWPALRALSLRGCWRCTAACAACHHSRTCWLCHQSRHFQS